VIPTDEPQCGFMNEQCIKDDGHVLSMIISGILGLILFCSIVITISIYRKWKIELEIEGLLWKIDRASIKGYFDNGIVSSPSKVSGSSLSLSYQFHISISLHPVEPCECGELRIALSGVDDHGTISRCHRAHQGAKVCEEERHIARTDERVSNTSRSTS
jgi:hypothetical protein